MGEEDLRFFIICLMIKKNDLNLHPAPENVGSFDRMSHGVTGNTSGFGPEESRFEP
jgi:hypothetical protein